MTVPSKQTDTMLAPGAGLGPDELHGGMQLSDVEEQSGDY